MVRLIFHAGPESARVKIPASFIRLVVLLFWSLTLCACLGQTDPVSAFNKGDYETAHALWLPMAREGDPEAQNYLGIQYFLGLGVERDIAEAAKWYETAARQGHPNAQRNYADLFNEGNGVRRDFYTAYIWYYAASQQGNETASRQLAALAGENKLSPNQQMHAKLEANEFIADPKLHFQSHDTYTDTETKLSR